MGEGGPGGGRQAAFLSGVRAAGRQVHVGILLENVPDYLSWTCAAALAGAVAVGINPMRRGYMLAADIRHTDCDLIVTEDRLAGLLGGLDHGVPNGEGFVGFWEAMARAVLRRDPALLRPGAYPGAPERGTTRPDS